MKAEDVIILSMIGAYLVSFVALIYSAFSGSRSPAARAVLITIIPIVGFPLAAWYSSKHPRGE